MRTNAYLREELLKELRNVSALILKENDIERKLYLFSAAYGVTSRTVRYNFDRELLLIDAILNMTYNNLQGRLSSVKSGDRLVPLTSTTLDVLARCLSDIADAIEKEESCYGLLQRLVTATYITTGPGYYQSLKGQISADD